MKMFIYPSLLQKQGIPALKKGDARNVIIRYREMNGIKLTLLLPLLHNQIKFAIMNQMQQADDSGSNAGRPKLVASLVLCHASIRASEMVEFATELSQFCSEIVEVVNVDELSAE